MSEHKQKGLQTTLERNLIPFMLMTVLAISVAGIVEIVPLFYLQGTLEDQKKNADGSMKFPELAGVRPYTALELAGVMFI